MTPRKSFQNPPSPDYLPNQPIEIDQLYVSKDKRETKRLVRVIKIGEDRIEVENLRLGIRSLVNTRRFRKAFIIVGSGQPDHDHRRYQGDCNNAHALSAALTELHIENFRIESLLKKSDIDPKTREVLDRIVYLVKIGYYRDAMGVFNDSDQSVEDFYITAFWSLQTVIHRLDQVKLIAKR